MIPAREGGSEVPGANQSAGQGAAPAGPHVTGLFATREQAEAALDALLAAGFPSDAVSAVTAEGKPLSFPSPEGRFEDQGKGAAIGAVVGAVVGFVVLGPLLLFVGALAGGLAGLLTAMGASSEQADYLVERIRAGHYLVVVHAGDEFAKAESILENAGARDVHRLAA